MLNENSTGQDYLQQIEPEITYSPCQPYTYLAKNLFMHNMKAHLTLTLKPANLWMSCSYQLKIALHNLHTKDSQNDQMKAT